MRGPATRRLFFADISEIVIARFKTRVGLDADNTIA